MTEWLGRLVDITWVEPLMASYWVFLILFAFSAIDAFFPVVPSESLVITAGVYAAAVGDPNIVLAALSAAAGAFTGDNISRLIGRFFGTRYFAKPGRKGRRRASYLWAKRVIDQRGGLILVVARYIPAGRTAVTLTCGAVRYRLAHFLFFAAIAALTWATYSVVLGYAGGKVFEEDPILGVVVGISMAIGITAIVELIRFLYHRRLRRLAQRAGAAEHTESVGVPDSDDR